MFRAVDRERSGAISESSASCPSQRAGTSMTRLRALLPRLDTAGFMDLCEYLSLTVQPKALPRRRSTWVSRLRSTLHGIATHPSFRPAFDVLVLVNTALIVIQSFDNDDQGLSEALRVATMSLLAVFVVEMAVMLGGLGFDKFVQSSFNVLDLSSVLLAVISSVRGRCSHRPRPRCRYPRPARPCRSCCSPWILQLTEALEAKASFPSFGCSASFAPSASSSTSPP